jgi:hypothetical protein
MQVRLPAQTLTVCILTPINDLIKQHFLSRGPNVYGYENDARGAWKLESWTRLFGLLRQTASVGVDFAKHNCVVVRGWESTSRLNVNPPGSTTFRTFFGDVHISWTGLRGCPSTGVSLV